MTRDDRMNRHRGRRVWAVVLLVGVLAALTVPAGAGSSEPRFLTTWGGPPSGSGDGQFSNPRGVAVAPDGTVYVADTDNHRIQYFDAAGTHQGTWGGPPSASGDGQFSSPSGVAVAPDGTVYVADTGNHRIQYFTPTGTFIDNWGEPGSGDEQFNFPYGVAVAEDGTVYVADDGNHRIQYFTATGEFIDSWGELGSDDEQFSNPRGIAVAADGTVYVADNGNDRIQYFTPTGTHQGTSGSFGDSNEQFSSPVQMAVAADGTVYVADQNNHRIQYFTPIGEFLGTWGTGGDGNGQFEFPEGVAVGPFGIVYVADTGNQRIQKFVFPEVTRAAGANRFATAAAISQTHHPVPEAVDTVFVATGANFPDALAGAVAAATSRAPLLLTSSVPEVTADELDRLDPDSIVILGGTSVVSAATATQLSAWGTTIRLSGANRYETAVAISQYLFAAGSAETVVIATGTGFADALAGATLAALGNGPVLLTQPGDLPETVRQEILRLDPDNIVVLGGTAAVSDAVMTELNGLAPTTRVSGPNRYDTAVEISEEAFPDGAGVVYIAVGTNFPDALAGAAQAAAWGAPVLLTPSNALPQSVVDEITRLDPHTIVILGGEAVVSPAVETQLEVLLGV